MRELRSALLRTPATRAETRFRGLRITMAGYGITVNVFSALLDLITRLGARFDAHVVEEGLPIDPLFSSR